jgi:RNA polymerase sigma-70 factor (ECF subfamily)
MEFLAGRPALTVMRERRRADRREVGRRRAHAVLGAEERRRLASASGRRVGERRAPLLPFRVPAVDDPRHGSGVSRLLLFAQRIPHPASEIERLESGWLVTQVQAGSADASERLYRLYVEQVTRHVDRALRDPHRVDDVVQEVFVRVLRALPRFDPSSGHFGRWLSSITRNYLIDVARSEHRIVKLGPDEVEARADTAVSPSEPVEAGFMELVRTLPLAQRQVLFLRYVVDLSWHDVGLLLGRSSGAVRMLQLRAHQTLRAREVDAA